MVMLKPDPFGEERALKNRALSFLANLRPGKASATILVLLLIVGGILLSLLTGGEGGG